MPNSQVVDAKEKFLKAIQSDKGDKKTNSLIADMKKVSDRCVLGRKSNQPKHSL